MVGRLNERVADPGFRLLLLDFSWLLKKIGKLEIEIP